MLLNRNVDLSVYNYLKNLLSSIVTVTDGYPVDENGLPKGDLTLPLVASERQPIIAAPFELGGKYRPHFTYAVDIYARTKAQRDDIAYTIQDDLSESYIPVYDYTTAVPSGIGAFVIEGNVHNEAVYVFPQQTEKLYWRAVITFTGYVSP